MSAPAERDRRIPHVPHAPDAKRDHETEMVGQRLSFIRTFADVKLPHVTRSAIPPSETSGHVENLIGATQIPLGVAGPLLVNGRQVHGELVLVPFATTEGSLVATYTCGMQVVTLAGGVTTAVSGDATHGARVTAEATISRALLVQHLRSTPESIARHCAFDKDACHAASAIAALFIATGQDLATIGTSATTDTRANVDARGDLRFSIFMPSLCVATRGGGTRLPTQRECLDLLGCIHADGANRLAEIVAATVLAGGLAWAAATSSLAERMDVPA